MPGSHPLNKDWMKLLVTALLVQQFWRALAADESSGRPARKTKSSNTKRFSGHYDRFDDPSERFPEPDDSSISFATASSESNDYASFPHISSYVSDDDTILESFSCGATQITLSPQEKALEYLRADMIESTIEVIKNTPTEGFSDEFWRECTSKLFLNMNYGCVSRRRSAENFLRELYDHESKYQYVVNEAFGTIRKVTISNGLICPSYGIRELLEFIPKYKWAEMSPSELVSIVCVAFGHFAENSQFPSFTKIFIEHLRSIFERLGVLSKPESNRILMAFSVLAPFSVVPVSYLMLFDLLVDHLEISDTFCDVITSLKVKSIYGKEHYELLLKKFSIKVERKRDCFERALEASINDTLIAQEESKYSAYSDLGFIALSLKMKSEMAICLDEQDGPLIANAVIHYLNANDTGSTTQSYFDDICEVVKRCDIYVNNLVAQQAFDAYYLRSSASDSSSEVLLSVAQILGHMFESLDKDGQSRYLPCFVDLFIATRQSHLIGVVAFMFTTTKIKNILLAQLYSNLFTKVIDGIDEAVTMGCFQFITKTVLPILTLPQYKHMLRKLANSPIDVTQPECYYRFTLLLTCLVGRPVDDRVLMGRLGMERVLNQQLGSLSYVAAVRAYQSLNKI